MCILPKPNFYPNKYLLNIIIEHYHLAPKINVI